MQRDSLKSKTIIFAFLIVTVIILMRLFYIQVIDDKYSLIAKRNALFHRTEYPPRGLIYDRNGNLLVSNQTIYDIMVIPREMGDIDTLELCNTLNIDSLELAKLLNDVIKKNKGVARYQQTPFIKQISPQIYTGFQEKSYKFPGFYTQARTTREYYINSGGNLLGYINEVNKKDIENEPYYQSGDYIGKTGIEASYEKVLRGKKGVSIFTRDVRNRIQDHYKQGKEDSVAIPGNNLIATIDSELQNYGEKLMKNKFGSIVAIEPATGEILALVSSPSFDPNLLTGTDKTANFQKLVTDPQRPLFNRAIMSAYPPGSTFKLATALIGLQEGVLTPQTHYSCTGRYRVGRGVGCHGHKSYIDLTESIMVSCNTYYCHVFRNIIDNKKFANIEDGLNKWIEYCNSFGFGKSLGSDLYGEKRGTLPTTTTYDKIHGKNRWKSLSIISLSIGQGEIGLTPLQIANFTATIANRGYYIKPHIVKDVSDKGIDTAYTNKQYTKVDAEHYKQLIEGMWLAVNAQGRGATATRAHVQGLDICGKTGTVQNPHGENHAVFICFAPRENPKIAVAVFVENAGYGGTWAAPIGSLFVEKYLTDTISREYLENHIINSNLLNKRKKNAR